jgi:Tfp pilus assembly protein PilP
VGNGPRVRARVKSATCLAALFPLATCVAADDTSCPAVARTTRVHDRHRGRSVEHEPRIVDLVLKGIVKTAQGYAAMLQDCVDKKNWTVAVGQRFHDGRVTAIDADGITFEVDSESKASPAPKPTTKRLTLKPAGK